MNSLKKIQVSNNSLLNWVLQSKDNFNDLPFYTKDMFCNHLEVAYSNQETTSCNSKINTQKGKMTHGHFKNIRNKTKYGWGVCS